MTSSVRWRFRPLLLAFLAATVVFAWAKPGQAQEATLTGIITDSTGGVLPGVTVTATNAATGNTFVAVTDGAGRYRIPLRIGGYQITAELLGFATVVRTGVELLIGQTVGLNLQMSPSTLQETVTVTGEAPLIDVTTSTLGSNIDPRQMQDLPVNGSDWTSLALLAPGNRTTAVGGTPVQDRADVREYHMNLDGQQVTAQMGTSNQPRYSRDSIAEFQFISNRFDATQGRSSGVQVNAITKAGSNLFAGTFAGTFRNSSWNAEDHVLQQVVPLTDQQYSSTFGGPIVKDKLHFFANFEYQREPRTSIWNTPYPSFNISMDGKRSVKMGGVRLDYQLSQGMRLMGKVNVSKTYEPFGAGNNNYPANARWGKEDTKDYLVQFTQVMSSASVNEIKGGYAEFGFANGNLTTWSKHWLAPKVTTGFPRITFTGFSINGNSNDPRNRTQYTYMLRDDFTTSYEAKGRHDMKAGGEYLYYPESTNNCARCMGQIDARGGRIPANIEALFPDPFNADTWNLNAISPITRRYTLGVGDFQLNFNFDKIAGWVQDDWHLSDRLTANLGLRYDIIYDSFQNFVELEPWMKKNRPQDANNFQPRLGFAYTLNDRTVLRGGGGKYYGDVVATNWALLPLQVAFVAVNNDGRPDFASNPFNGPAPSFQQVLERSCYIRNVPGCIIRDAQELAAPEQYAHIPHSWQYSLGFQRQLDDVSALEVDYVYNRSRDEKRLQDNANVSYDPATGANLPFSNRATRPFPDWGVVGYIPNTGLSNFHGIQSSLNRRFSDRWQASATYTLGWLKDNDPLPLSGLTQVSFPLAPDLGGEYGYAITDQRHRAVVNGIWQVAHGFQLSGLYFFGSGERFSTNYGGDLRGLNGGTERLRPNGTIVPRNNIVGDPIHRVDIRLQQRIPLGTRRSIDGIFEVFNVFDRANYGDYETEESNSQYGQPSQNSNLAYSPRSLQLGFRLTF